MCLLSVSCQAGENVNTVTITVTVTVTCLEVTVHGKVVISLRDGLDTNWLHKSGVLQECVEPYDEEEKVVRWKMCDVALGTCAKLAKSDCETSVIFDGWHSTSRLSFEEFL